VPVDLIDGRTAADLSTWLTKHSGPNSATRIITRDRSTEYINAITPVWPDAQQIADRWHLLNNLRDVIKLCWLLAIDRAQKQESPISLADFDSVYEISRTRIEQVAGTPVQ